MDVLMCGPLLGCSEKPIAVSMGSENLLHMCCVPAAITS
jgi:hypothetical protein